LNVGSLKAQLIYYGYLTIDNNSMKNKKGKEMKILQGLTETINSLTTVVISLLGLGIAVSLLGGNVPFVGGVAENIIGLVQGLGDAEIIGFQK